MLFLLVIALLLDLPWLIAKLFSRRSREHSFNSIEKPKQIAQDTSYTSHMSRPITPLHGFDSSGRPVTSEQEQQPKVTGFGLDAPEPSPIKEETREPYPTRSLAKKRLASISEKGTSGDETGSVASVTSGDWDSEDSGPSYADENTLNYNGVRYALGLSADLRHLSSSTHFDVSLDSSINQARIDKINLLAPSDSEDEFQDPESPNLSGNTVKQ